MIHHRGFCHDVVTLCAVFWLITFGTGTGTGTGTHNLTVRIKSDHGSNDFSSHNVEISHPLLDWGEKYLHFPSLAYLTVENRHNSSILNVFEPYSTNRQFYPCNQSEIEIKIKPGEIASLCFVFFPKWLGSSSAHIILQTSSGGFLVRAHGLAVQPPYMSQSSGSTPFEPVKVSNGMSVLLDDHEVKFPVVLVGNHYSKWIQVVNPSDHPVSMKLVLNSGEIIDECREFSEENFRTLVINSHAGPSIYGFSVPHNGLTEAYVDPHGKTVLGPVIFHPSSRCAWKSSAIIRNNLSGVEWLSLRGSGGLVSMVLHDGSGPVHSIELNHNSGQPFMKVLFANNTGDLPVKVDKIMVSGTKCELDGFVVGSCNGFVLQPGESRKIIISYRAETETCAETETVLRDLELGLVGGILVVPVKVRLPKLTLAICKRSRFWIKLKKFALAGIVSVLVFVARSFMFSVIIPRDTHSSDVCLKPVTGDSPKAENLSVNIGKEKARRRKKKRSLGNGLTGYIDGPSSHSSNSTPSSPLSPPIKCLSPNRARSPFHHGVKEKGCTPLKAKAPEPKRKLVVKLNENEKSGFEYNIWGCHLELRDLGCFEVGLKPTIAKDASPFVSLFEMGPQELFAMAPPDYVTCKQND